MVPWQVCHSEKFRSIISFWESLNFTICSVIFIFIFCFFGRKRNPFIMKLPNAFVLRLVNIPRNQFTKYVSSCILVSMISSGWNGAPTCIDCNFPSNETILICLQIKSADNRILQEQLQNKVWLPLPISFFLLFFFLLIFFHPATVIDVQHLLDVLTFSSAWNASTFCLSPGLLCFKLLFLHVVIIGSVPRTKNCKTRWLS